LDDLDYGRLLELAVLGTLTLAVLFFGVRPLVSRLLPVSTPAAAAPSDAAGSPSEQQMLAKAPTPDVAQLAAPAGGEGVPALEDRSQDPLAALEEAVEASPDDAVRVLRGWLQGAF
jgi:flagellar biosynthesis/type III secretory pathway M-ring protein FliF/YscJ